MHAMNPNLIIEATIRNEPIVEYIQKWQLRPLRGWPDGVDPFPQFQDEDVVQEIRHPSPRKLTGKALRKIQNETTVEFDGAKWFVVDVMFVCKAEPEYDFKAVEVLAV